MPTSLTRRCRFCFLASNEVPWGGSEELWARAAILLAERGHAVTVVKRNLDDQQPRVRRLRELKCRVWNLSHIPTTLSKLVSRLTPVSIEGLAVRAALTHSHPDLVVVTQGGNLDGWWMASLCRRWQRPYAIVAQKAGYLYWPADAYLTRIREAYTGARACYFVSDENRRFTEQQLGVTLRQASVVRNPFMVPWRRRDDWPETRDGFRLACVGRLYPVEKGQDLLIRVLARDKWRNRPLSVTFFGTGPQGDVLQHMAAYHQLRSVSFAGFEADVPSIWNAHHGLILPSRCEGLPLVLVEAMLSGRVPITTDVAGHREIVDDNINGFLAAAASDDALDEALERAWLRRHEWPSIGAAAATHIRTLVPPDPAAVFADTLLSAATAPSLATT